jgi:hypothetical protein
MQATVRVRTSRKYELVDVTRQSESGGGRFIMTPVITVVGVQ